MTADRPRFDVEPIDCPICGTPRSTSEPPNDVFLYHADNRCRLASYHGWDDEGRWEEAVRDWNETLRSAMRATR